MNPSLTQGVDTLVTGHDLDLSAVTVFVQVGDEAR